MQASKEAGARVMELMSRRALKRLIANGGGDHFFNADELGAIRRAIEQTNSTANLLGRARIRERARHVMEKQVGLSQFSEADTFVAFAEVPVGGVPPLPPVEAVDYFTRLVPELDVTPEIFGPAMRRRAFTMAIKTDVEMLKKVKTIIGDSLATGRMRGSVPAIQNILDQAGVTPANPQYADLVMRTNTMEALNQGAESELQSKDMQAVFPAWEYLGILDGRERKAHRIHFNKLFPNHVSFAEIRDSVEKKFSGFNCRCSFRPVDRYEFGEMEAAGREVESQW